MMMESYWRRLVHNPATTHDSVELELSRAWEPWGSLGPFSVDKGKETQNFVSYGNKMLKEQNEGVTS